MNPQPAAPDQLQHRVIALIVQHQRLRPEDVTIDSTFANLGIDSFDEMELLAEFEDAFDLTIPNDIARYVRSVRDCVDALRILLQAPALVS